MRWRVVRTVLAKELKETLRDRRTLFMMIVIPTLLYPALMVPGEQLTLFGQRRLSERPAAVAVAGGDPATVAFLRRDSTLRILPADSATVAAVRAHRTEAAVVFSAAPADTGGLVPLAVLFSALFLGIAVRSQSFKEAQNALTPVQLASTLPILVITLPGIDFSPALAAVPVVGIAMMFRALMSGSAPLLPCLVAFGSTALYAALALHFAAAAFGREDVLFGGGAGTAAKGGWRERMAAWRAGPRRVPLAAESLACVAVVALLYFHVGTALQAGLGERGLLASQWGLLFVPALLFATAGPFDARRTLGLHRPTARGLAAAVVIALAGIPIGWAIGWAQLQFMDLPRELFGALEKLVTATDLPRFLWLLLLVAVTPAVCEEVVFRGVLFQGLAREERMWRTVALSALVFGAFHLSGETAIRFLPTAWLGLLMGIVVWRTRSIFSSMLMHFVNNGFAVVVVSRPEVRRALMSDTGEPSWWLVALAPLALAAGLWLLPRRTPLTPVRAEEAQVQANGAARPPEPTLSRTAGEGD